jgi:Arc/MetJ-type ribon-helix-helix transcriptional regulator
MTNDKLMKGAFFVFGQKIKISNEMMAKIRDAVDSEGYSSIEEFVETALERELERVSVSSSNPADSEDAVRKQLQGLGYIE